MNWKHLAFTAVSVLVVIFLINRFVPSIGAMIFGVSAPAKTA